MKDFVATVITIVVLIGLISVIDLFANGLSVIPGIGPVIETLSEAVFESLQIALSALLGIISIKKVS